MAYKNTQKKYKTRREKLAWHIRNGRIIILFVFLAIFFLIIRNWDHLSFLFKTYFVY